MYDWNIIFLHLNTFSKIYRYQIGLHQHRLSKAIATFIRNLRQTHSGHKQDFRISAFTASKLGIDAFHPPKQDHLPSHEHPSKLAKLEFNTIYVFTTCPEPLELLPS
ncbi:hypothetical protein Ancab_014546 [Ancistrocladus abbreviatus]